MESNVSRPVLAGPPQHEWDRNRSTITRLYAGSSLPQVRIEMKSRGFNASEKMYRARLQKWGLSKYTSRDEKHRLVQEMKHSSQKSSDETDFLSGLDENELLKLNRYIKAELSRRRQERLAASPQTEATPSSSQVGQSDACPSRRGQSPFALSQPVPLMLAAAPERPNILALLHAVQSCCLWPSSEPYNVLALTAAGANEFWRSAKQAIYFFRIGCTDRAWPNIETACNLAVSALAHPDIYQFAIEAIATFSPVNMRSCPAVRRQVITYLAQVSKMVQRSPHPIVVILEQLILDGPTRDVSERCFSLITDTLKPLHGQFARRRVIQAHLSLARHLRKDGEHEAALKRTQRAYETAVDGFGPESIHTCKALREQMHILIDNGSHEEALRLCSSVASCDTSGWSEPDKSAYNDCCIATMEDIAYIFEKMGDEQSRAAWLHQADQAAESHWGHCDAASHIQDRIKGLRIKGICA